MPRSLRGFRRMAVWRTTLVSTTLLLAPQCFVFKALCTMQTCSRGWGSEAEGLGGVTLHRGLFKNDPTMWGLGLDEAPSFWETDRSSDPGTRLGPIGRPCGESMMWTQNLGDGWIEACRRPISSASIGRCLDVWRNRKQKQPVMPQVPTPVEAFYS